MTKALKSAIARYKKRTKPHSTFGLKAIAHCIENIKSACNRIDKHMATGLDK